MTVDIDSFQNLPMEEIARLVQAGGPQVCCFPIDGTRRWYLLEAGDDSNYLLTTARKHIELYKMVFAHGVNTLLAPVFGAELLGRGPEYVKLAVEGLTLLATHPDFLNFYREYGVRVRFYGNYRKLLSSTPYAYLSDLFDQATEQTIGNTRCRLFFGVFGSNPVETVADLSVRFYSENGRVPDERQVIEAYYGEYIGPVNLFIGFNKFWVYDMPLLPTDNTNVYFLIPPSLYISQKQLRAILFDHLYLRWAPEPDYEALPKEAIERMQNFYQANKDGVLGIGSLFDGIWYPSGAEYPAAFTR